MTITGRNAAGTTIALLALIPACSSSSTTIASSNGGASGRSHGTGAATSAGSGATLGGSSAAAGASSTAPTLGGASNEAGATSAGGLTSTVTSGGTGGGVIQSTGGTASMGGASTVGAGGVVTGGRTSAAGNVSTAGGNGGAISNAGATAAGGRAPIGGSTATGGQIATGGRPPATGGAPPATGGLPPATGGSCSGSVCNGVCTNVQTDKSNCGTCGRSCLGASCTQGQCEATVLGASSSASASIAAKVLYVDSTHVYYTSSNVQLFREPKTDLSGTGTSLVGSNYYSNYSVVGGTLYWNVTPTIYYCTAGNCSSTQNTATTEGNVIANVGANTSHVAVWYTSNTNSSCSSASFCLDWLNADSSIYTQYSDSYIPSTSGGSETYTSFTTAGNLVYWIANEYNSASAFVKGTLFSASTSRAQLAGGLSENMTILDVNDASVILSDASGNLFRVPLPLGLGTQSPQSIGVTGVAAVEDAGNLYWIDSQGTVYQCTSSSCASTTVVRANGQASAARMRQDSTTLYWGRANPSQVMKMAK